MRQERILENYRGAHETLGEENQRLRSYANMLHELHQNARLDAAIQELLQENKRLRDELQAQSTHIMDLTEQVVRLRRDPQEQQA